MRTTTTTRAVVPSGPRDTTDQTVPSALKSDVESLLPPSHAFLGAPAPVYTEDGSMQRIMETDVGISEYVGHDVPQIEGIIKQRFTDFLVFEVDLESQVIHLKSLGKPESSPKSKSDAKVTEPLSPEASTSSAGPRSVSNGSAIKSEAAEVATDEETIPPNKDIPAAATEDIGETESTSQDQDSLPERITKALSPFLSEEAIIRVRELYQEGPEPPFVSDSGWGGRQAKQSNDEEKPENVEMPTELQQEESGRSGRGRRGRDRGGRSGRGGRGGRGGGRGGREDHRRVLTDPIASKDIRTGLHQAIRQLFGGKLDSETDTTTPAGEEGSRIVIKWSRRGTGRGGGRGGRTARGERPERGTFPPYIHFTLQKTNRDTQDALAHLSRSLHVNVKDISVAGTKDKRGVTVQRVSLKRGNKTVEDIWKLANGVNGRRTEEEAVTHRGERGIRIADFNYRKASLELGMLKGNAFVITLRNVQVDTMETLDRAMNTIKTKGFINYYGMQRFGTASIPTHSIGLALLKSDWHRAISLILRHRPGEHPEVVAARDAWLVDGDLDKALELMPRRVVAERCILESYKKQGGDTRNAMGALSTIPRNLRLMYVHAYQSYVWNAIVSERIKMHGAENPVAGDLVFEPESTSKAEAGEEDPELVTNTIEGDALAEEPTETHTSGRSARRLKKPWEPPKVKTLTAEDLPNYTIFDVIMPLPGKDVAFPGGPLGERYKDFLRADGLDPDNFVRKQKEYSLGGSYRKILHLPKELSWSVLRYTDPDVALAQADEDKLLGFDPPAAVEDGKFMALQVHLTLGTAAYATMALREVTKTETSSHFQSTLTQASEDQKYKTTAEDEGADN
ncbi:pseudouridine synthase [Sparassis latifolia]|uniref:Pseudouridine synthase n=1 Tax=Sparassis crispa TaxID=139825 RepID=A0A401GBX9_9APHY|nr:Putative pseudouridine synthase [Sparassis crispa]GBE79670.1 Putative pseudouridine synthase [Sparassis crispa]